MHDDEVGVDDALVRRLLATQLPQFAGFPLVRIEAWGTDHAIFRLGDDLSVRLPKIGWATKQGEKESRWLPELAPPADMVSWALSDPWTDKRWATFATAYRKHMSTPEARHLTQLLAKMSHQTNLSVGCYCEDETRCHRSLLRELLVEAGADVRE